MVFVEENSLYRRFNKVWHVLGAVIALSVAYSITKAESSDVSKSIFGSCLISTMSFIFAWGFNMGMMSWVSFIAGLVMYKNLDRPTFAFIQSKLFPIYFAVMGILSGVQFAIFMASKKNLQKLSRHELTVAVSIFSGILCGFLNSVWIGPATSKLGFKKLAIEKEEGVVPPDPKLKDNAEYRSLSKQFGKYHGMSSLLNLFAFSGSMYVMYFIATELFLVTTSI